jgi:hypothetical protein
MQKIEPKSYSRKLPHSLSVDEAANKYLLFGDLNGDMPLPYYKLHDNDPFVKNARKELKRYEQRLCSLSEKDRDKPHRNSVYDDIICARLALHLKYRHQFESEMIRAKYGLSDELDYDHFASWKNKTDHVATDSAIAWSKRHCDLDEESYYYCKPDYLRKHDAIPENTNRPGELGHDILMVLAWLLDTFMEIKEGGWKETLADPESIPSGQWFRGRGIERKPINLAIVDELELDDSEKIDNVARTVDKHVSAANKVITSHWVVYKPLSKRGLLTTYRTLYGFSLATIRAAKICSDEKPDLNSVKDSPDKVARYLIEKFPLPPGLTNEQVKSCLKTCWQ